jgi:predicted RNA-binding Zn-ribbon protein involved in translation (DUF1610 family)
VPWCPTCDRFLSPPTVTPEGTCPQCGQAVKIGGRAAETGRVRRPRRAAEPPPEEELPPVPRHLKVLGAAMVVYLGYRFLQGVEWLVHRF